MKASELVKELTKQIIKHGDKEVMVSFYERTLDRYEDIDIHDVYLKTDEDYFKIS